MKKQVENTRTSVVSESLSELVVSHVGGKSGETTDIVDMSSEKTLFGINFTMGLQKGRKRRRQGGGLEREGENCLTV